MKTIALSLLFASMISVAGASSAKTQIEAFNKSVCAAMKSKDFAALSKLIKTNSTSDFVYIEDGRKQTMDHMLAGMKMGLAPFTKFSTVETKIVSFKETGRTVNTMTKHKLVGTMGAPGSKPHVMTVSGSSTDTFVKEGSAWKMSKMVWVSGEMMMDGKPMPSTMGGH